MLKKFGLLIALVLSLAGCGKDTKTASADNQKTEAPLVGCYKEEKSVEGAYFKITESSGKYRINALPNPDDEGKDIRYIFYSGNENVIKAISGFKSSEEGKKKFSEMVDSILVGENAEKTNIVFFKVKQKSLNDFGSEYSFIVSGDPMPVLKFECPK